MVSRVDAIKGELFEVVGRRGLLDHVRKLARPHLRLSALGVGLDGSGEGEESPGLDEASLELVCCWGRGKNFPGVSN